MTALTWVAIGVAGAIGAPARYLLDGFVQDRTRGDLPHGTFVVNVVGSLMMGLIVGFSVNAHLGSSATAVLGTGFSGALTTFSAFSFETARLLEGGDWRGAGINVVGSLIVGLVAAAAGLGIAEAIG